MGHGAQTSPEGTAIHYEARTIVAATGNSTMNTQFIPQVVSSSKPNEAMDFVPTSQQHLNDRSIL